MIERQHNKQTSSLVLIKKKNENDENGKYVCTSKKQYSSSYICFFYVHVCVCVYVCVDIIIYYTYSPFFSWHFIFLCFVYFFIISPTYTNVFLLHTHTHTFMPDQICKQYQESQRYVMYMYALLRLLDADKHVLLSFFFLL